jgi:hypothetical protein
MDTNGRVEIRYFSRAAICGACPLRARCLAPKAAYRSIARWEHEDVIERHRARMQGADAVELMRRRSAIVEHPFGTLKCRAGSRHFLVRGFDKVRGEWSLMALCYNFTRVLNILGFERFVAYMAAKSSLLPNPFWQPPRTAFISSWAHSGQKSFHLSKAAGSLPHQPHNYYSCPASSGKSVVLITTSSDDR